MAANTPTLPLTRKTGPGRKRSGPVPAWALKIGTALATLSIFAGSFGFATSHLYITSAPLQPAVGSASATTTSTPTATSATQSTTSLSSSVRTTTRTAVTTTKSS